MGICFLVSLSETRSMFGDWWSGIASCLLYGTVPCTVWTQLSIGKIHHLHQLIDSPSASASFLSLHRVLSTSVRLPKIRWKPFSENGSDGGLMRGGLRGWRSKLRTLVTRVHWLESGKCYPLKHNVLSFAWNLFFCSLQKSILRLQSR